MTIESFTVEMPTIPVTVRHHAAASATGRAVILAPGAGATLDQPFLQRLCADAAEVGFDAFRFNFPYRERGASRPDTPATLEATWRAILQAVRERIAPTFLAVGGRSMGGRIASMVVAGGEPVSALLLLAYPLRSPSGKGASRTAHLPAVAVPTLFVSGTRDQLAPIDDLREAVPLVPGAALIELEGGDHSFATAKAAAPGTAALDGQARRAVLDFLLRTSEVAQ